jgi:4-amino-4-deoxy-L-arabinose transferase-like glycosyltransferase
MNFLRKNKLRLIFLIFICAYILAHLFFFNLGILKSFNTDYREPINMILEGNLTFINEHGELWNRGPFLYPLILALQLKIAAILNVNALIITSSFSITAILFSGYILYKIARLYFSKDYKHAQLTLILYLSIPFNIYSSSMPLSEIPFAVFILLSIYYLLKGFLYFKNLKYFVLSGIALGLALLVRPIGILLPIVYSLIIFSSLFREYKKIIIYRIFFFLLSVFLTILPWSTYNYIKTDKIILLSSNGVASIKDGLKLYHKDYREKQKVSDDVKFVVDDFYKKRKSMNTLPDIVEFLKDKFKEDKWAVLNFYIYKAKRVWFGLDSQSVKKERIIKIIGFLYIILFMIASYKIFKRKIRSELILLSVILFITLTFWGMAILVVPLLRYVLLSYGLFTLLIPIIFDKQSQNIIEDN